MKYEIDDNSLKFIGELDETCPLEDLRPAVHQLNQEFPEQVVHVDFSKVSRANSLGIVTWLKLLQEMNFTVSYVNCPPWLVTQFNLLDTAFFKDKTLIESIYIPFYCEELDHEERFLFHIGKDIPIQSSYDQFELTDRLIDGHKYVPDITYRLYFAFLTRIKLSEAG